MRTTCLYCELDGVETELVRVGHWGACPIHSAKYLASLAPPPQESAKARMDREEAERRKG